MRNKINVYWSEIWEIEKSLDLLTLPLSPVLSDFYSIHKDNPEETIYLKCPAVAKEWKNTFVVKSPLNFTLQINPEDNSHQVLFSDHNFDYANKLLNVRQAQSRIWELQLEYDFIADQSLEMSQIPASLHINEFTLYTSLFSGRFNINKWTRPLFPVFKLHYPIINVKRGDALFYVRFHTNDKINLINFDMTKEIYKSIEECTDVKLIVPSLKLESLYKMFQRKGRIKKVLNKIKQNTTNLK